MSRIGKMPIEIPGGVSVEQNATHITVKGPKGELTQALVPQVKIAVADNICTVTRLDEQKKSKQMHGLYRQLVNNMVIGVSAGFERKLNLVGVGYRAELKKESVMFNLGYSMPIEFVIPEGITINVEGQDTVVVNGISKELVGKVASEIRLLRKPEPYKGKGIKYSDEVIRRKEGKSGAKK